MTPYFINDGTEIDTLYATHSSLQNTTLPEIGVKKNATTAKIPLGKPPDLNGLDINYITNMVYVANSINDTVTVIDGFHNKIL